VPPTSSPPPGRARAAAAGVVVAIGVVMMLIGGYVALRPLWAGPRPLTTSRWLDMGMAAFFLLRGWMNVRTAGRFRRPPTTTG